MPAIEKSLSDCRYYFHPSGLEEGAKIMTAWIAEVRALLTEARGVEAELMVRAPRHHPRATTRFRWQGRF